MTPDHEQAPNRPIDRSFTITTSTLTGLTIAVAAVIAGLAPWTVDPATQDTLKNGFENGAGWVTVVLGALAALAVLAGRVRDVALIGAAVLVAGLVAGATQPDSLDGRPVDAGWGPGLVFVLGVVLMVWSGVMQRRAREG